jgi:hypothetical protein
LSYDDNDFEKKFYIEAGSVNDGKIELKQPLPTLDDKYLRGTEICNVSKYAGISNFILLDDEGKVISYIAPKYSKRESNSYVQEGIMFMYFKNATKLKCNETYEGKDIMCEGDNVICEYEYDIDAQAGWNKVYYNYSYLITYVEKTVTIHKSSTKNILTNDVKWTIDFK